MKRNVYQEVILEVSKDLKLGEGEVERMVDSQFKFITKTINQSKIEGDTVQLIYLGKWASNGSLGRKIKWGKIVNDKKALLRNNTSIHQTDIQDQSSNGRTTNEDM
jgi:nucleoid DNA-binding protein